MLSTLLHKVNEFFVRQDILPGEQVFLLACSGGIDSMAMAGILQQMQLRFGLAHCNFKLRGAESDEDERFVQHYANEHSVPFHVRHFDTAGYASKENISIQMAARQLRYDFFNELLKNEDYDYLITAHHLDDNLETLLINLGRGTGISGLKGIDEHHKNILRPLTFVTREEIYNYAAENGISWREDSSNKKVDYQRNFIRHQVVPPLKKAFPNFQQGFITSLGNLRSDFAFFEEALAAKLLELVERKDEEERINIPALTKQKGYRSLLYHWLAPYQGFDISAIERSLDGGSGRIFESRSYTLLKDRAFLILRKKRRENTGEYLINESDLYINEPLSLEFGITGNDNFEIPYQSSCASLDFDKLDFPLHIRKWRAGDQFIPLGMKNFKKLSDFFIDEKLSLFEKSDVWLLCSDNSIVWVIGHRIDERFRITDQTKKVYFARLLN